MDEIPAAPPVLPKRQTTSSTNQEDEDEMATVKVLPAVTLQIWGSLLNRRGYQISGSELVRTTSAPAVFGATDEPPEVEPGRSVISAFRRANSFAPAKFEETEGASASRQPFRRTATSTNVFVKSGTPLPAVPEKRGESSTSVALEPAAGTSSDSSANKMFAGYRFRVLGEAKTPAVKSAIESYGGHMVNELDEEVDFIIVRLVRCVYKVVDIINFRSSHGLSGSKLYREEADPGLRSKYRTECWLERCIFEDQVCPPDIDISFTPLAIRTPVPGTSYALLLFFKAKTLC